MEAGADVVVLCDTNGGQLPLQLAETVGEVISRTGFRVGIHCQDDTACAVANSIAAVQAGGLGMVALGLTQIVAARASPRDFAAACSHLALPLCVAGLLGVFAVGYPGYFVFDSIWPGFYYAPVGHAKNLWLIGQGAFVAVYFLGTLLMFNAMRTALDEARRRVGAAS